MSSATVEQQSPPQQRSRTKLDEPLVKLALWWAQHEIPLKGYLMNRVGVSKGPLWKDCPPDAVCRGMWHGYQMKLDVRDFYQRLAFFYARYNQLPVQLLMLRAMRKGDVFVDGGANLGLLTMLASWIVGDQGEVHAFEPNPDVYSIVDWHITNNDLRNVRLYATGLSDEKATATLRVPGTNTGAGTIGQIPSRYHHISAQHDIELDRGDVILSNAKDAPSMIKLDVEGHELGALRGMRDFIASRKPAIITEVNPEMLVMNGTEPAELMSELLDRGYKRFRVLARWSVLRRRRLIMPEVPTPHPPRRTRDEAFVHPDSPMWQRLERHMRDPYCKGGNPLLAPIDKVRDRI